MKPILFFLSSLLLFASCGGKNNTSNNSDPKANKNISIDGSSTVYPITEAVAEEFGKVNPNINVTIGTSGTGGGFKKFSHNETDICNASRPITAKEDSLCLANGIKYLELPIAYDGLVVVANLKNTWVDHLTVAELKMIFESAAQGKITKWSQIRKGFPNKELSLFGPGTDSGTFDYFTEAVNGQKGNHRGDYTASEDDNTLVQGVIGSENALAYFGLAYYEENKDKLKAISIDGGKGPINASIETVQNGTYSPLSRPLFIYVKGESSNPAIDTFVNYYLDKAKFLSEEVGYVPLQDVLYEKVKMRYQSKTFGSIYQNAAHTVPIAELLK
ncbi:MAG: PstS family phosphate ABC transporter substrate-binding protein [Bacteroidota bacterium]|nr:PstS family phosphate ABC transporter substrate-binding protein [Bacteroidota bacterium]